MGEQLLSGTLFAAPESLVYILLLINGDCTPQITAHSYYYRYYYVYF